jgi:hypothetical protein
MDLNLYRITQFGKTGRGRINEEGGKRKVEGGRRKKRERREREEAVNLLVR